MKRFVLVHSQARQRAAQAVQWADDGDVVTIAKPKKSRIQEEKYHAMIGDIAAQYTHADGRSWRDEGDMKRVLVSAFKEDTKRDPEFAPLWAEVGQMDMEMGLRGEVVVFGAQTRKFQKKLGSAFIEWLHAFGAENGIRWSEPGRMAPS